MKWIFLSLISFPISLIAQQVGTINPTSSVTNVNADISALNSQIAAFTNQIKSIGETVKQSRQQLTLLIDSRSKMQSQLTTKQNILKGLDNNADNYASEQARLEKELADLSKKIVQVDNQITAQQSFIDKQTKEMENLQSLINQQKKKIDELESRNQQKEKQKEGIDSLEEHQAEAYAHVRIINDSLPAALSGLNVSERTIINGFNTKFNNDLVFRSKTLNYVKQANVNSYFSIINKAGPVNERNSRFLMAARQELAILSKN